MRTRNGWSLNQLVATSTDRTAMASTNAISGVLGMAPIIAEPQPASAKKTPNASATPYITG